MAQQGERRSPVPASEPSHGDNVRTVTVDVQDASDEAVVSWDFDGHHYHFFTTLPAIEPRLERRGIGRRRSDIARPTIFKNLASDAPEADRHAFRTRYLDASKSSGRRFLDDVRTVIARDGLVDKAYAARTDRVRREALEQHLSDVAYAKSEAGEELYDALLLARDEIHSPGLARQRGRDVLAEIEAALAKAQPKPRCPS